MDDRLRNRFTFKKQERIKNKKDFEKIFSQGRRLKTEHFQVIICENDLSMGRIAIIVGKRYGEAHQRNKIKRRIREIYRLNKDKFPPLSDCVIIPRKSADRLSFHEVKNNILNLLEEKC